MTTPISRWHPCRLSSDRISPPIRLAGLPPALGIDPAGLDPVPLSLDATPGEWRLSQPDGRLELQPGAAESGAVGRGLWPCRLRRPGEPDGVAALICQPDPHDPTPLPGRLEVLAAPLAGLSPGELLELGVDGRRCRLIQPSRLRARLLEFLKFRVLAAQETFFEDLRLPPDAPAPAAWEGYDLAAFRAWLAPLWPEALDLADGDLRRSLEQARALYLP